jgi:PAS domain S-box-containing protein
MSNAFAKDAMMTDGLSGTINLADICNPATIKKLLEFDHEIYANRKQMVVGSISFETKHYKNERWVLKYPVMFSGKSEVLILTLLFEPVVDNNFAYHQITPEFLLQSIINGLPDLIFFKNTKGQYIQANKAFYNFNGITELELIGKTDSELFSPEKAEKFMSTDQVVFSQGIEWEGSDWDKDQNGKPIKFETKKFLYATVISIFLAWWEFHTILPVIRFTNRSLPELRKKPKKLIG